eukprot:TRINITY_DN11486_c0_g1_i3.p1 TRINITY_DN11486_c0_g1~~TRINITY_DN11486_c0_g1_i3.p1  ORF type:complete len:406 (-),score=69.70 TRINITY_DN11486_c0_g1_i3:195-1412(-)
MGGPMDAGMVPTRKRRSASSPPGFAVRCPSKSRSGSRARYRAPEKAVDGDKERTLGFNTVVGGGYTAGGPDQNEDTITENVRSTRRKASNHMLGVTVAGGDAEKVSRSPEVKQLSPGASRIASPAVASRPKIDTAMVSGGQELPVDDFVEGGVELPPSPENSEMGCPDLPTPQPTMPLSAFGDRVQLEAYWPSPGPELSEDARLRALFLDYDGTLREFENRPEQATPTPELMELLRAINAREDLIPHIISGRDAKFLGACFGELNRFTLIAEHGFQIWREGTSGWELTDHPDGLDRDHDDWKAIVRTEMNAFVDLLPRSHVEEKSSSLVWHYREVPDQEKAEQMAVKAMERLHRLRDKQRINKIQISNGHKVVEVSYRKVRKGPVMRRICEQKAVYDGGIIASTA